MIVNVAAGTRKTTLAIYYTRAEYAGLKEHSEPGVTSNEKSCVDFLVY